MPNWISLRAYARHRGDALSAVQKAIKAGRVSEAAVRRDGDRLTGIDQEQADRDWALNTDPAEALKNGKDPSALLTAPPGATSEQLELAAGERAANDAPASANVAEDSGYLEARTREKQFQAKKAELDYLERVGELVSSNAVREEQFDIFRQHRDKLEQIPASISERLAAETDPERIEHALRTEIRKTLNELSRAFAVDGAPGGIEERATVTA